MEVISSLMIMLNDGYYNSSSNTLCYRSEGDGANLSIKETICDFSGTNNIKGINTLSKKMIDEDIIWNIGGSTKRDDATLTSFYNDERGKNSYNGQPYEWSKSSPNFHSIGLIYPSDFILATNGGTIGRESCLKAEVYNWFIDDYQNCSSNDWLFYRAWSLTSNFNGPNTVFIYQENVVDSYVQNSWLVHPSLYLKSTLKIHDGIGSLEDSFQIEDYYL